MPMCHLFISSISKSTIGYLSPDSNNLRALLYGAKGSRHDIWWAVFYFFKINKKQHMVKIKIESNG